MVKDEMQRTTGARLEWLDALRGFTMILVVAYHVSTNGFGEIEKSSMALPFLVLFRMPLFFFISGFLAYKPDFNWTGGRLGMMVWKKFRIQVIPTLVFLLISLIMYHPQFWNHMDQYMLTPYKMGYWFTLVLLQMFIIYYVFAFFESRIRGQRGRWIPITLLWLVALVAYAVLYMPAWFKFPKPADESWLNYTSFIQTMRYFHFFVFGNIVHRYWKEWQRLFDSKWFFPVLIFIVVICCSDIFKWHTLKFQWTNLPRTTAMYGLMLIVFIAFRYYQEQFTKKHVVGRCLQFIGVRTLDIYLLHFLFLPNLKMVGDFINVNKKNFVIDISESVAVAILVIGFCCLVSSVLRISPIFRKYLFGRK
jgi:peptidoglycan/LPS O-acetylase OafA/YrhL